MISGRTLAAMLLAFAGFTLPLHAAWVQIDVFCTNAKTWSKKDGVAPYWRKSYKVDVTAISVKGVAEASARSLTESVSYSHAPENGLSFELWRHFPPGVGEVEVRIMVSAQSSNQTKGPGLGKSATLVYCRGDYWFDDARGYADALISNGARNTRVEGLPTFSLGLDLGVSTVGGFNVGSTIPISWFSGSGLIQNSDLGYIADLACPVKKFRCRTMAKGSVYVWARGSSGNREGRAYCNLSGFVNMNYGLLTHGECPDR